MGPLKQDQEQALRHGFSASANSGHSTAIQNDLNRLAVGKEGVSENIFTLHGRGHVNHSISGKAGRTLQVVGQCVSFPVHVWSNHVIGQTSVQSAWNIQVDCAHPHGKPVVGHVGGPQMQVMALPCRVLGGGSFKGLVVWKALQKNGHSRGIWIGVIPEFGED